MICLKNKKTIVIITNHNFHLHNQLVDASQMLGKFEIFYYNRNIHIVSPYEKPNFIPPPHLIWYFNSQIPGKEFLIIFKKSNRGRKKFQFLYLLSEKTSGPMPSKVDVMKILQFIMT